MTKQTFSARLQMKKMIFSLLTIILAVHVISTPEKAEGSYKVPYVSFENAQLLPGQVGMVHIKKPINLWKKENGKLVKLRILNPGEKYRVYQFSKEFGGQYGLGGNAFITKMDGFIEYKTPSKHKLRLVNPHLYGTKLSAGPVIEETEKVLAAGVTQKTMKVSGSSGPQSLYVMSIAKNVQTAAVETSLANNQIFGFERLSSQAAKAEDGQGIIIGGINGDYFDGSGAPTDLMIHDGEVILTNSTAKNERTIFGIDKNFSPMIGNPDLHINVSLNGAESYPINSINKRRSAQHLVIYTPHFGATTRTNALGTEVVVERIAGKLNGGETVTGRVKEVQQGIGNAKLSANEFVLSGHASASNYLKSFKKGDQITINLNYDDLNWNFAQQAIGGRYMLVKDGIPQKSSVLGVNPRSAVGIKADGTVMTVVVDGRNPQHSRGMTIAELGVLMKDLGAIHAMTFDGGGSSAMVVKGNDGKHQVINKPSDGWERSVANALLIKTFKQPGKVASIKPNVDVINLEAGQTLTHFPIYFEVYDQAGIRIKNPAIKLSTTIGSFDGNGQWTVPQEVSDTGILRAEVEGVSVEIAVIVKKQVDSIDSVQDLTVTSKDPVNLLIKGMGNGKVTLDKPSVFKYAVTGGIGTVKDGIFYPSGQSGTGEITISYGLIEKTIRVYSIFDGSVTIEPFENHFATWKVSGRNYETILIAQEKNYKYTGNSSIKLNYNFIDQKGPSSVIADKGTPLVIPGKPVSLSMMVFGDAKGHSLSAELMDAAGNIYPIIYTENLDWTGWKEVTTKIPESVIYPVSLVVPVIYSQQDDTKKNRGQIFVDDLKSNYK
ncbi:phosphodiester glycosidase family protein [Jeotgalibacillus sp. R-1-5s-1]|uniref:phosphodiester glycosidase family protein n=1 Tax=Jeotgalibacillus sp. R-1-5s-1 TaxID=2555897 RepID=UPI00106D6AB8|nr:phosphodiester glycosidase family protein [Jeotgalibacillus sp. R-1-5s-1]TFD95744.1 phosphodiester glycosidase family protein [Jeotgalibacillus sp. R-1-5s-1]